jgi:hypothetical protein
MVVDHAQEIALAYMGAGSTADMDLPLALADRDRPDVLDVGFRAVARTAAVASLSLAGLSRPRNRVSISVASPMLSPSPKRQKSVPMQLLQVR